MNFEEWEAEMSDLYFPVGTLVRSFLSVHASLPLLMRENAPKPISHPESLFAENLHRISCQIFLPGLDLANSHFGWNTRRHRLCHKV